MDRGHRSVFVWLPEHASQMIAFRSAGSFYTTPSSWQLWRTRPTTHRSHSVASRLGMTCTFSDPFIIQKASLIRSEKCSFHKQGSPYRVMPVPMDRSPLVLNPRQAYHKFQEGRLGCCARLLPQDSCRVRSDRAERAALNAPWAGLANFCTDAHARLPATLNLHVSRCMVTATQAHLIPLPAAGLLSPLQPL